jgi:hypothetical protein
MRLALVWSFLGCFGCQAVRLPLAADPQFVHSQQHISQQVDLNEEQPLLDHVYGYVDEQPFSTPSRYHSTLLARRLLALSSTAVLTTVFPRNLSDIPAYGRTPADVAGISIGLPEYIADCEGDGNPTIIALGVSTSTKNAEYGDDNTGGTNVSLSVSWWDQYERVVGRESWSQANLPRLSLLGHMEEMSEHDVKKQRISRCFTEVHKDARLWIPGSKNAAHQGKWARIVVEEAYFIGGFGGANYIGWLDPEEWKNVGDKWKVVRLRGEKP